MKNILGGKMKRSLLLLFTVCCLLFAFFLWGCGTGPGAPGSIGCEDFGLICEATITPTYLGANTDNVDAVQDICDPGPPPTFEDFTDHGALAAISVRLMNPNASITPPPLFIERFTIEYRRNNDSIGTPPIQSDSRSVTFSITPPTGNNINTVTRSVIFVDLPRKDKYLQDMVSGIFSSALNNPSIINNYTAIYTFEGQIQGKRVSIHATKDFSIGHYLNCGG
jgi:hypothetical protein